MSLLTKSLDPVWISQNGQCHVPHNRLAVQASSGPGNSDRSPEIREMSHLYICAFLPSDGRRHTEMLKAVLRSQRPRDLRAKLTNSALVVSACIGGQLADYKLTWAIFLPFSFQIPWTLTGELLPCLVLGPCIKHQHSARHWKFNPGGTTPISEFHTGFLIRWHARAKKAG